MFDDENKIDGENEINSENEVKNESEAGGDNSPDADSKFDGDGELEDIINNFGNAGSESGGDFSGNDNSESVSDNSNDSQNDDAGKQTKKKSGKKLAAVIVACVVVVALFATGIYGLTKKIDSIIDKTFASYSDDTNSSDETTEYPSIASTIDSSSSSGSDSVSSGVIITDVSDVVDAVMPSIVAITSTTYINDSSSYYNWLFGNSGSDTYVQTGAGSGIIIGENDSELLIVTNNHVVDGADSLTIQFVDDTTVEGYVKGTDSSLDLAIVSIPLSDIGSDTLNTIKIATLGDSDELEVGDGVIAIGNALGYGQSVTTGVVSAFDRQIVVNEVTITVLQTDAAINGGNSGGALLNSSGEVIGINCAKYSSSTYSGSANIEGMGFAIPISSATDIIDDLMNRETRMVLDEDEQGSLGIYGYSVSSDEAQYYSIPVGVLVTDVIEGEAADKAGIVATDVITAFDGQEITTMAELKEILQYYAAGEKVTITVSYRDGRVYSEKEVEVTLSSSDILSSDQQSSES